MLRRAALNSALISALTTTLSALPWLPGAAIAGGAGPAPLQAQRLPTPSSQPSSQACAQAEPPHALPADMPALAASYRVTFTAAGQPPRQQVWRLRRSATELVWDKGDAITEWWRRDAGGIRLDRLLHGQQAVVAYSAGELRTLWLAIDWQQLARLLSDTDLAQLRQAAPGNKLQRTNGAVACRGRLWGDQVALQWDSLHQLPLRLQRRHAGGQVLFERTALYAGPPPGWPATDARSASYRLIDAADLGDLHHDPAARLAQQLDQRLGWRTAGHP